MPRPVSAPGGRPVLLSADGKRGRKPVDLEKGRVLWQQGTHTAEEIFTMLGLSWKAGPAMLRAEAKRNAWGPNLADLLRKGASAKVTRVTPSGVEVAPIDPPGKSAPKTHKGRIRKARAGKSQAKGLPPEESTRQAVERAQDIAEKMAPEIARRREQAQFDPPHPFLTNLPQRARAILEGEVLKELAKRMTDALPADIVQRHKESLVGTAATEQVLESILAYRLESMVLRLDGAGYEDSKAPDTALLALVNAHKSLTDAKLKRIIIERQIWQLDSPGGGLPLAIKGKEQQPGELPARKVIYLPSPVASIADWADQAKAELASRQRTKDSVIDAEVVEVAVVEDA